MLGRLSWRPRCPFREEGESGSKSDPELFKSTFLPAPNRILALKRISRTRKTITMARSAKSAKSPAAAKTNRPVTLKHLAAALADDHHLTKRAGEALLGDLVGLITKHLKNG